MPTVEPGNTVLVTGASGFIAAWITKSLLEEGFCVRGTVRDESKGAYLARLFAGYGERFGWVIVKDIGEEGAFDKAVQGVQGVVHAASPFHFQADDPEVLIRPAVRGTLGVLESVLKYGEAVQRVVVLSSVAAVLQSPPPGEAQVTLTEANWNTASLRAVTELGRAAPGVDKYRASKTLAEKAAWEFVATHKESIKWDLTTLNPPLVWGPTIHDVPTAAALNTSIAAMYTVLKGTGDVSVAPAGSSVDVRDLALAHVRALVVPQAGGERFLIACRPFTWQDFVDAVGIKRGAPGAGQGVVHPVLMDTTKAREVLGLVARDFGETARDSAQSLLERERELGW